MKTILGLLTGIAGILLLGKLYRGLIQSKTG